MQANELGNKTNDIRRDTQKVGWIYYAVILSLTLFRIIVYVFFKEMSDNELDIAFTSVTQILLMGIIPFAAYNIFVAKGGVAHRLQTTSDDFGYHPKLSPALYVAAILIGLLVFYANYGAAYVSSVFLRMSGYTFSENTPVMVPNVGSLFMWLFFTALLPACFEEMSHRGLLLGTFEKTNERQAIVLSALMFALMHQNIIQTFYAFIAGLIMGSVACYTRSIIPAMIIHFMNNAFGVILDYSEQHGGKMYELFESVFSDITLSKLGILIVSWAVAYYAIYKMIAKVKLFCKPSNEKPVVEQNVLLSENPGMILAITLGVITTIVTFIWGLAR